MTKNHHFYKQKTEEMEKIKVRRENLIISLLLSAVVVAVVVLVSTALIPVRADYTGDHPLTTYAHGKIHGDLIYTIGDSEYMSEISPGDTYTIYFDINLPKGSKVKIARLYAYWDWSHAGEKGVYPEMGITFDGNDIKLEGEYTDRKGDGDYDYPSGTYCYDITDYLKESGVYIATVENTAWESKSFSMIALGLLMIYEDESEGKGVMEYWINEGCDILNMKEIEDPEEAVTTAKFDGNIDLANIRIKSAKLLTIVPAGNKGENTLIFNDGIWNRVYAGDPYDELAIDKRDVTDYVVSKDNFVKIEDNGDFIIPSGAFLILRYREGEELAISPTPTPMPTSMPLTPVMPSPSPIPTHPTIPTTTPPEMPMPKPPGFEAVFSIAAFLILTLITHIIKREKK
jgi:hypothetical protein